MFRGGHSKRSDISGLLAFIGREGDWRERLQEVVAEHLAPVLEEFKVDPDDLDDLLGAQWSGVLRGCGLEDFLSVRYDDGNIVDLYLKRRGVKETALNRACLAALRDTRVSLHEASEIRPGESMVLRDLLADAGPVTLRETSATRSLRQWDRIAVRVVPARDHHVISGARLRQGNRSNPFRDSHAPACVIQGNPGQEVTPVPHASLLDHFSALDDPRQRGKVVYPLPEVMFVVLCGTLAGAEDFVEIATWGRGKLDFLRGLLPFARGIASHDTLDDVMNALDGALFAECFTSWVEGLRAARPDIVAIDGKTSRRARGGARHPLHVVSAWASRRWLVLGQQATEEKSNEITAIPLLLERLHLAGALVTIDAMGTRTKIAEAILARGADYLLALKDNQRSLAEEVALYFDCPEAQALPVHETVDADHGRVEIRRHRVSHDVAWLNGDRCAPGEPRFPGIKAIAMVEAQVERAGRTITARRFFLSSLPLDAPLLARAVRAYRGIENRVHWVLDVVFHDDLMRLRTGNGPQNMDVVKHMAPNLLRTAPGRHSLKIRRKKAAWDQNYLQEIVTGTTQ